MVTIKQDTRGATAADIRLSEAIATHVRDLGLTITYNSGDFDRSEVSDILNTLASIRTLRPALAANPAPTSPQLAFALQATENAWRGIAVEFGMLSSRQVSELLGAGANNRNFASARRTAGQLLGVLRGKSYLYPGFQFDRERGIVLPVVPQLLALARESDWTDADLILWLNGPTTSFEDEDRPVDHIVSDPDAVLAAAQSELETLW